MSILKKFFISLKEIFIILIIQYSILIFTLLIFGKNNSIILGTIFLMLFEIIYIIKDRKTINFSFNVNNVYFPYILLGTSISIIYNMILYKLNLYTPLDNNISILLIILASGVVGPIFEELIFRINFISRLEMFIYNKKIIILLSSLVFALCHANIINIVIAFIVGIINSYIYIRYRSTTKIFLVHIFVNITSSFIFKYNIYIFLLSIILLGISILIFIKHGKN
ncbi:MAG: CPBP family intramembrane glutamic endopeptidase [Bacilli bacterium]